jgi:glucans biosynthesis protein C
MVYPFSSWHQTVIVAIAFYVVQWEAGIPAKHAVIALASLAVTIAICEVLRRMEWTRFLSGMKVASRGGRRPEASASPA